MWILNETEENKREIRLVRMINSEIEETKKYIKYLEELKSNPDKVAQLKEDKQSLENYKKEIVKNISNCPQLEKDSNKNKPDFKQITTEINKPEIYPCYARLSQTIHGSHAATWIDQESLGNSGTFGEIIEAYHWHTPLYVCYYTLSIAGRKCLQEFAGNPDRFIDGEIQNRLEKALKSLQKTDKSTKVDRKSL